MGSYTIFDSDDEDDRPLITSYYKQSKKRSSLRHANQTKASPKKLKSPAKSHESIIKSINSRENVRECTSSKQLVFDNDDSIQILDESKSCTSFEKEKVSAEKQADESLMNICCTKDTPSKDDAVILVDSDSELPDIPKKSTNVFDSSDEEDVFKPRKLKNKRKSSTPVAKVKSTERAKRSLAKTPTNKLLEKDAEISESITSPLYKKPKKKTPSKRVGNKNEVRQRKALQAKKDKIIRDIQKEQNLKNSLSNCKASIDQAFLEKLFTKAELHRQMIEYMVSYNIEESPLIPLSVMWYRAKSRLVEGQEEEEGRINELDLMVTKETVQENHLLTVVDMPEFVNMVNSYKTDGLTLFEFADGLSKKSKCTSLTILVHGLKSYFRTRQNKVNAEFRAAMEGKECKKSKKKSLGLPVIEKSDIEEALVEFEMMSTDFGLKVCVCWSHTSEEIVRLIAAETKAVAEAPFKRRRGEQMGFAWYVQADSICTVDPKTPVEAAKLWRRQLQQFPKVSRDIADAIAGVYETPMALLLAYEKCDSSSAALLLADIRITGIVSGTRRIGPDLSKKLHMYFTCRDGDKFIASG